MKRNYPTCKDVIKYVQLCTQVERKINFQCKIVNIFLPITFNICDYEITDSNSSNTFIATCSSLKFAKYSIFSDCSIHNQSDQTLK